MFVQLIISLVFYIFCEYAPKADARNEHNSIGPTFGGFNQKQLDAPYFSNAPPGKLGPKLYVE